LRFRRPGMTGVVPVSRSDRRRIRIVALVTEQIAHPAGTFEQRGSCGHITDVALRQHQREGTGLEPNFAQYRRWMEANESAASGYRPIFMTHSRQVGSAMRQLFRTTIRPAPAGCELTAKWREARRCSSRPAAGVEMSVANSCSSPAVAENRDLARISSTVGHRPTVELTWDANGSWGSLLLTTATLARWRSGARAALSSCRLMPCLARIAWRNCDGLMAFVNWLVAVVRNAAGGRRFFLAHDLLPEWRLLLGASGLGQWS